MVDPEEAQRRLRRQLEIPQDEVDVLHDLLARGVDASAIRESGGWSFLGPRRGVSDARRLRGAITRGLVNVQEVVDGRARARHVASQTQSRQPTHEGRHTRVKRGQRERARECDVDIERDEWTTTTAAQHADTPRGVLGADSTQVADQSTRRKLNDASMARQRTRHIRHVVRCGQCNTVLDSRKQFEMECRCEGFTLWWPCEQCFIPIRRGRSCDACTREGLELDLSTL